MSARAIELGRLYVVREQIDALIDAAERELAAPAPACDHPIEQRKYEQGTMGSTQSFTCSQCSQTVVEQPGA